MTVKECKQQKGGGEDDDVQEIGNNVSVQERKEGTKKAVGDCRGMKNIALRFLVSMKHYFNLKEKMDLNFM